MRRRKARSKRALFMKIAEQKFQENIAEYVPYMYQIEDVIRAYNLDIDTIMEAHVKPQIEDQLLQARYRQWYIKLINEMKSQKKEKSGHLASTQEVMVELSYLHNTMINMTRDKTYIDLTDKASKFLDEFREKSNLKEINTVELAFHGMYMKLLLRLQKKEISEQTEEAFEAMRGMLAYLSQAYHKMKSGDLDFLNN